MVIRLFPYLIRCSRSSSYYSDGGHKDFQICREITGQSKRIRTFKIAGRSQNKTSGVSRECCQQNAIRLSFGGQLSFRDTNSRNSPEVLCAGILTHWTVWTQRPVGKPKVVFAGWTTGISPDSFLYRLHPPFKLDWHVHTCSSSPPEFLWGGNLFSWV